MHLQYWYSTCSVSSPSLLLRQYAYMSWSVYRITIEHGDGYAYHTVAQIVCSHNSFSANNPDFSFLRKKKVSMWFVHLSVEFEKTICHIRQ